MTTRVNGGSPKLWLLPIIVLAFALRLYRLDAQSMWFDEIVIVALAKMPWYDGFLAALGQGSQLTPVFHGVIKLWLSIGDTDWLVRVPAVLLGVLAIPVVFKVGQIYFGNSTGLLGALFFAANPYQVWYAQELKLYALLPFVAGGAMYAFGAFVKSSGRRGWGKLIFFSVLGLPSHYFLFLISTVQFLYIIITFARNYSILRRWLAAQVIGLSPLIAWWLFILWQQYLVVGINWIPRPDWFTPLITFSNFTLVYAGQWSVPAIVPLLIAAAGLIWGLESMWQQPDTAILLTLWLFFPPIVVWLLSFGKVSFYVDRYFLIVTPVLTITMASGLWQMSPGWLGRAGIIILLSANLWGLWRIYFDTTNFSKEDWRSLAQTLDDRAAAGDVVITCTDGQWLSFEYYNPHQSLEPDQVFFAAQAAEAAQQADAAWVVDVHPRLGIHHLAKTVLPELDRNRLSSNARTWELNNLDDTLTVPSISAYYYNLTDPTYLPEVVDWHCQD